MWGCEFRIYVKNVHSSLPTCRNCRPKHLKDRSNNVQNIRSGKISIPTFEIFKDYVRPHGCHIYNTAVEMPMAKMCTCTSKYHGLAHCKYVLRCCDKFPNIVLTSQDAKIYTTNTCSTIRFIIYRNVLYFTVHGRRPYNKQETCSMCSILPRYELIEKVYTHTQNMSLETSIHMCLS